MPLPSTMTPIATNTLAATASSVTFSSVPQGYTDLVLITSCSSSTNWDAYIRFNSDSGSNYSYTVLYGTGSAAGSYRASDTGILQDFQASVNTEISNRITQVMNYSNTTTYKTLLNRANRSNAGTDAIVGLWRNTAAITTLEITSRGANTFAAGSTFTLYGIKAA